MNIVKSEVGYVADVTKTAGSDPAIASLDAVFAVVPQAASGAIGVTQGFLPITKSSAFAALTLAVPVAGLPSAGGNDGNTLFVLDTTGKAHTVTTPASGINGSLHIATFGGTIGNYAQFVAYNGIWYVGSFAGVTLS